MDKEELIQKYIVPDTINLIGVYWVRLKNGWRNQYALVRCKYEEYNELKDGILIFNRRK